MNIFKKLVKNIGDAIYLFNPFWKHGKLYVIVQFFTAIILIPLNRILYVNMQRYVIDSLAAGHLFWQITVTVLSFSIAMLLLDLFDSLFYNLYGLKKYISITGEINKENYKKAISTDYKYFDNPDFYNTYTYAVNERSGRAEQARLLLIRFFATFMTTVSLAAVIASSQWVIILIIVITLILSTIINNKSIKINHDKYLEQIPIDRKISYIHNLFCNKEYAADQKTNRLSKLLFKHYNNAVNENIKLYEKYKMKIVFYNVTSTIINSSSEIIISIYLVYLILNGDISIGAFASTLTAAGMLKSNMGEFFGLFPKANELSLYADKIKQFYDLPSQIENKDGGIRTNEKPLSVEFKNVNFKYNNSEFGLHNISMKINPGDKIALVGENGAGKTTIVKLLLRLYDTDSGAIMINGDPITDYDIHQLRSRIGIAFQNSHVFAISLSENMQLYNDKSDDELMKILGELKLSSVLDKANASLTTDLTKEFDKDGIVLSGGEIQKLSLSRILFGDFGLLIFDEPSSALDPIAEYELANMIFEQSKKATTVIIAHRLSTIRDADMIYLIDNGEIKECGNHDQLMANKGRYYEMFTKQAENYIK